MTEKEEIWIAWGLSYAKRDITNWTKTEWSEAPQGEKKRLVTNEAGQPYWDYLKPSGNHQLIKITPSIAKQEGKTSKQLAELQKEKEDPPEKTLYEFVKEMNIEFCSDQFSNKVAVHERKYYFLGGTEFQALIGRTFYDENESVFSESTWNKFLKIVTFDCLQNKKYFPLRCHTEKNSLYYDTGKEVWKFTGGIGTQHTPDSPELPVIFRRYNHQLDAPTETTTRSCKDIIEEIISLFNITAFRPEVLPLCFCSEHPNPISLISGDPGAAKSTFTLFLKTLVDPDQVDKLTLPEDLKEFGLHRQQFYYLLYDNVRSINKEQSDELCRMVTGGTSISRKLYTDGELYITKGLPRIAINGLRPEPSSFNDLLDRTLLFDMQRIKNSQPEKFIWNKLDALIPQLRYACLKEMSEALFLSFENEFNDLPRMSEFALLGERLNILWGGEYGSFVQWFKDRMAIAHASGMDDGFTVVLTEFLEAHKQLLIEGMEFSASEWRFKLEEWGKELLLLQDNSGNQYRSKDFVRPNVAMALEEKEFPKNATWIGRRFRDTAPLLAVLGYLVEMKRSSKENKILIKLIS